jgi:hypothetical protein
MASSTPGMANARSCIIEPIIPFESAGIKSTRQSRLQLDGMKERDYTVQPFLG